MLAYVYGHDEIVARFVSDLIPHCQRGFGPNIKAIGVVDDGRLIAGIVYHQYNPDADTIEISGAALPGKAWLSRETLKQMFQYPFLQLGCQMVVQLTPADNEVLLSVLARYGYTFIPFPRLFGRDRDGMICHLTREAWEGNRFNQRLRHHVADDPLEEAT